MNSNGGCAGKLVMENANEANAIDRASRCADRILALLRSKGDIPERGLPETAIKRLITDLASCDSNNRCDKIPVGAGEREGRVASSLVSQLNMGMAHGMGRSGNLTDQQPKAIGSSMLARIANALALDAIQLIGIESTQSAIVFPVATGMSLAFCMSSWRRFKPSARYVVFLRIDQLSCLKSIFVAGYEPIVIDCVRDNDSDILITDMTKLTEVITQKHEQILAVLSATSCFAPRGPDDIEAIGALCSKFGVKHLVNNAYGLQTKQCRCRLNQAGSKGHVDAFVQSLDKNFLVPVGGSIIAGFDVDAIQQIAHFYPGRASLAPSRDLVITLLQLGRTGLERVYSEQAELFDDLLLKTEVLAKALGERVFRTPTNLTSIALSLNGLDAQDRTLLGSVLFDRGITGARVVCPGVEKTICGYSFINYGSHSSDEPLSYLNIACAIGMKLEEIVILLATIETEYERMRSRRRDS